MEDAELVKKMLKGINQNEKNNKKGIEAEALLDDIAQSRTTSLKEAIDEIAEQMKYREKLHKEMIDDIEKLKSQINNMILQVPVSSESVKVLVEFQKKLIEAEEMKTKEKLDCFRDIAQLKKELREWIREFRDKEKRASFLGELLSD
jgi:hypothetical protein